jgi:hypothetical protein
MARLGRHAALALVLASLCTGAVWARRSPDETILIRFRHSYPFCAGLCPHFAIQVGPDGEVASHRLSWVRSYRFRVAPRQAEAFRRKLEPLRPMGERRLDARCERGRTADGSFDTWDDPRPDDVEILWRGDDSEARLTSCAYTHMEMRRTVEAALRVLGADPYVGSPARPED